MRLWRPAASLALALAAAAPSACAADEPALVYDGASAYVIVVAAAAAPPERRGAEELRDALRAMSGAELPIVAAAEGQPLPEHALVVGAGGPARALGVAPDLARLGPEGFVLKTVGPRLVIAGSPVRGTLYGCTTLLERLGVRWFTPKVTRVPQKKTIPLPALDETQVPAFEYREPYFTEAQDRDWAARNKVNGASAHLDAATGGQVVYHHFVHTFDDLVPPALYDAHPEYFPQIGGKRVKGYVQRCLTNPDVLKLAIERVRAWIREAPEASIYSVSQNDCGNECACPACTALVQKYGSPAGLYLWFVNQVAEAIEAEHPDKLIDTLAYEFTQVPPHGIAPRKNVRVRLCPISCCQAHPYATCGAAPNRLFVNNLRAWSRITDTLYIWHYNTNFAHYLLPFPDFDEFPAETRLYHQAGVKGIFFEGAYAPGGGGSDAELRSWVMARLLWDVGVDTDALVTEWMQGVYGPAWEPMRRWFDRLHQAARDPQHHFTIYCTPDIYYLPAEVLADGDRLFDAAEKLAVGDAVASDYVAKARLALRYTKLVRRPAVGEELDAFLAGVRRYGITQLSEGHGVDAWEKQYRERAGGGK